MIEATQFAKRERLFSGTPYRIDAPVLATMSLVSGVSTRTSRDYYEETAPVEFKLY